MKKLKEKILENMSNTQITTRKITFDIQDEITNVEVYFVSDEPDNPFWGKGTKRKSFPPSITLETILKEEIATLKYLVW